MGAIQRSLGRRIITVLQQLTIIFDDTRPLDAMQAEAHRLKFGSIFAGNPVTGDELKDEGMSKALKKEAAQLYRDHFVEALKTFPVRFRLTAEQLTAIAGRPPEGVSDNAVGAIMAGMSKRGLIRKTGKMLKPGRKERHSNLLPEWIVVRYD